MPPRPAPPTNSFYQYAGCFGLALLVSCSQAQGVVYRCQQAEGKVTQYQSTPCHQGEALRLDDQRTTAQQRESARAIKIDQQLGKGLEKVRVAQERRAKKQRPGLIDTRPAQLVAPSKPEAARKTRKKHSAGQHFTALVPKEAKGQSLD